jgi:SAM-dependent methyltransferase
MHVTSYENMKKFREKYLADYQGKNIHILDIGSQDINGTYKPLFSENKWDYQGLDICAGKNVDIVVKDIYNWKEIKSNSYDVIVSGQAFEHIEFFWLTMKEIARVLNNSGLCCIIAPSSGFEHKFPVDCWRFYEDGMAALARYASLELIEVHTFREPELYGVENLWQDTVLVCKKNNPPSDSSKIKKRMEAVVHRILHISG